jgi:hypothetical protein
MGMEASQGCEAGIVPSGREDVQKEKRE